MYTHRHTSNGDKKKKKKKTEKKPTKNDTVLSSEARKMFLA